MLVRILEKGNAAIWQFDVFKFVLIILLVFMWKGNIADFSTRGF